MSRKRSAAPASLVSALSTGGLDRSGLATSRLTPAERRRPWIRAWRTSSPRNDSFRLALVIASSLKPVRIAKLRSASTSRAEASLPPFFGGAVIARRKGRASATPPLAVMR